MHVDQSIQSARHPRLAITWLLCVACVACANGKDGDPLDGGHSGSGGSAGNVSGEGGSSGSSGVGNDGGSGVGGTSGSAGSIDVDAGGSGGSGAIDGGVAGSGGTGGTGGSSGTGGSGGVAPRGTGPGDWSAGDYPADIHAQTYLEIRDVPGQMGNVRQYKVHVPPSYSPDVPTPLVFCFHGLSQNPVMFCVDGAGMHTKSDAEGFILVMPAGFQNSWNGGTCCGGAATSMLDDIALVRAIFEEVTDHLNVDLARVYATGLSNGGYISYRLACEASDLFVAVAPGAGAIGMNDIGGGTSAVGDFSACDPTHPVSVLGMHGTADALIPYSTQKPTLDRYATATGCALTTSPATQPTSGGDTTCISYDGCPNGTDITGCTVMNGGHVWFGSDSCGTGAGPVGCGFVGANSMHLNNTNAAWAFFKAHAR